MVGGAPVLEAATRACWVREEAVLWRRLGSGIIILPPGSDAPLLMSGSAGALWRLLAEPVGLPAAIERLALEFGAPVDEVGTSVARLLHQLLELGAVRVKRGEETA
jgi:hypothetical protein